jgi:hypothetical protein
MLRIMHRLIRRHKNLQRNSIRVRCPAGIAPQQRIVLDSGRRTQDVVLTAEFDFREGALAFPVPRSEDEYCGINEIEAGQQKCSWK